MSIREYHERDLAALRAIHAAQGFDYALPDLSNPLFVTKLVLTDANASASVNAITDRTSRSGSSSTESCTIGHDAPPERIVGAALLRLTAEAYLLLDPRVGSPRDRMHRLLALHAAAERDAWLRGLEDAHAWLPPPIAHKFGKRLTKLGWIQDNNWTPYCKKLEAKK
jgi:hypothetical protein